MFQGLRDAVKQNGAKTILSCLSLAVLIYTSKWFLSFFTTVDIRSSLLFIWVPIFFAFYVAISKAKGNNLVSIFWRDWNDLSVKVHLIIIIACVTLINLVKLLAPFIFKNKTDDIRNVRYLTHGR